MNALFPAPQKKARIEIIPLIDVVFFLLATFVLFTLSLDKIKSLKVTLPVSGPPSTEIDVSTLFIQASDQGTYYVKIGATGPAEPITAAEIAPRLETYKQSVALPRVFIRGDARAKFGPTIFVFDQVRKAGIREVSIETTTSPTGN